jgi:hypothetical protein
MLVLVLMRVPVALFVAVPVTAAVTMRVAVSVRCRGRAIVAMVIRAAFRLEGSVLVPDAQAQRLDHVVEHMIGQVAQVALADLEADMAIAEMVGAAGQRQRILAGDCRYRLGGRDDPYDFAAVGAEQVAATQDRAARELDTDLATRFEPRPQPGLLPLLEAQHQLVRRMQPGDPARAQAFDEQRQRGPQNRK